MTTDKETTPAMASLDLDKLEALARAATPQNLDSAEDSTAPTGCIECPECGGDGSVELTADYCNYDGKAMGVQFYGIGPEHRAAEAFFRAANPAAVLQLVALARRAAQPVAPVGVIKSYDPLKFTATIQWTPALNGVPPEGFKIGANVYLAASSRGTAEGQSRRAAGGDLYECVGKGGVYELIGEARGAGKSKLIEPLAVYRDTTTGQLFFRTTDDFSERMAPSPNSPVGGKDLAPAEVPARQG